MTAHVCHLTDWIDERVLDMEHISRQLMFVSVTRVV